MAETKNTFTGGRMEKDLDSRLISKGLYRDALNFKSSNSSGEDVGALENSLSNKKLTSLDVGANPITVGMFSDTSEDNVYWFVKSDSGSYIFEYNLISDYTSIVIADTRVGSANILNFNEDYLITGVNVIVDTDEGVRLLCWTDNLNPPRCLNIERAKTYGEDNFSDAEISVIKAPPLNNPYITLSNTDSVEENHISEMFLRFAYRYQYLDGEYSALSSFTETAFLPNVFAYDYSESSNESMVNRYNKVDIEINTGSSLVKKVDIVLKESSSNTVYILESFIKEDEGWADNTNSNVEFFNNKIKRALSEDQLFRLFDAVPLLAKSQELIGNRLIYGNYTDSINIADADGVRIPIDFSTEGVSSFIVEGVPTQSMKSNRDYEIGLVYLDEYGRMTSVLTSDENTVHFANEDAITQNKIKVTVNNVAPDEASKFRFFLKQTRVDYDTLVPVRFYQDGVFVWIKLEADEDNKISEGDFLYVKSDSQSLLDTVVQTRVLEIKEQPTNFLDTENTEEVQKAGTYFKVKPDGYRLNESDFTIYNYSSYDTSSEANNDPIEDNVNVIEKASYYGAGGLNDLTESGAYTYTDDIRYIIEIDAVGGTDTFQWSDDDGVTWTTGVSITGAAQLLSHGVSVTFAATTGHLIDDSWIVSAKAGNAHGLGDNEGNVAYAFFKSLESLTEINVKDVIEGGAQIKIEYDEFGEAIEFYSGTFTASRRYDNLEEWFYGDNIGDEIPFDASRIWFRRGFTPKNVGDGSARSFDQDPTGDMTLIILSSGYQNNAFDSRVKINSSLDIFQSDQNIIFETIPFNDNSAPFYEIGKTYDVIGGYHTSTSDGDVDQSDGVSGEFTLDVFNCFSWGNGFESYKIKDLFNAKSMKIDTRPLQSLEDYSKNTRIATLTYSKKYEQTTNFNGINEFNLSTVNYKDLDDKYNTIQKLHTRDTNIVVWQEDKVHNIPYEKDILYQADGQGNVRESSEVLGTEIAYEGEFGISTNPESFATYGNNIFFTDARRGVVLKLTLGGLDVISRLGMKDYFRDSFRANPTSKKIGAMDLFNKTYVLHVDDEENLEIPVVGCGASLNVFEIDENFIYIVDTNKELGDVYIDYSVTGTVNILVDNDGVVETFNALTGSGQVTFEQTTPNIAELIVTVEPVSSLPSAMITMPCVIPEVVLVPIIAEDDSSPVVTALSANINVLGNDTFVDPVTVTITSQGVTGTAVVEVDKTITYTHDGSNLDPDSFVYQIDDGNSTDTATVSMSVKALGGGGGLTGQVFDISTSYYSTGGSDGETACPYLLDTTKYHDGVGLQPTLSDFLFNDVDKTIPFDGFNSYWAINGGRTIKVNNFGEVIDVWICGAGNA